MITHSSNWKPITAITKANVHIHTQIHDMIAADGAVVDHNIWNSINFDFHLYRLNVLNENNNKLNKSFTKILYPMPTTQQHSTVINIQKSKFRKYDRWKKILSEKSTFFTSNRFLTAPEEVDATEGESISIPSASAILCVCSFCASSTPLRPGLKICSQAFSNQDVGRGVRNTNRCLLSSFQFDLIILTLPDELFNSWQL